MTGATTMQLDVLNTEGKKVSTVEVEDKLFDGTVNESLIYEVVKMKLANRRSGTASTKTRGEVAGSNAKPWRQKGTGRARAGRRSSPIWRHGGVVFGPRPRDYSYSVPKKVLKGALRSALQLKINEGRLKIFDSIDVAEPRTKKAIELFGTFELTDALVVIDGPSANLQLATRNLRQFKVLDAAWINVYDILRHTDLVMTRAAFEKVESRLR